MTRLPQDVRFRLDDAGFLAGMEFKSPRSALRPGNLFLPLERAATDYESHLESRAASEGEEYGPPAVISLEVMNRVFFSLALMNCRNVTLRERGSRASAGTTTSVQGLSQWPDDHRYLVRLVGIRAGDIHEIAVLVVRP